METNLRKLLTEYSFCIVPRSLKEVTTGSAEQRNRKRKMILSPEH